jgi:hypothetical protein
MKKALVSLMLLAVTNAIAADWENPEAKFNAGKNKTTKSVITWRAVPNVQAVCEAESRKRGNGGFGYMLDACSFWDPAFNTCTIITSTRPTMHEIGHEMRHCFQGEFH